MNARNFANHLSVNVAVGLAVALSPIGPTAAAQNYQLTKYLDTDDSVQVPGAAPGVFFEDFDSLESPSVENGVLCFDGRHTDPDSELYVTGIYTVDAQGIVTKIAEENDLAPGTGEPLGTVADELIRDGMVSFRTTFEGIFIAPADGLSPISAIVDVTDLDPISGQPFNRFDEYSRDGDFVMFVAKPVANPVNAYIKDMSTGQISVFAATGDPNPFPGGEGLTLDGFDDPMVNNGRFSIKAETDLFFGDNEGLLTDFGNGIVTPVNMGVASPSGFGNFDSFDMSSIDGSKVVFQAGVENSNSQGIYLYDHDAGTFDTIADNNIPRPGGGFFNNFNGTPSISVENGVTTIIFETGGSNDVWAWVDGQHIPIVREGDLMDGKTVSNTSSRGPSALEGTTTAVVVQFDDFSEGLYLAELICLGDLDGDDMVGQSDLGILLASFNADAGGDLDDDGMTTQADLGILLAEFGNTCSIR